MKDRLLFIDVLRIVGITFVVIQHIMTSPLFPDLQQFAFFIEIFNIYHINYGSIGVSLFIFASGCSLAINHGEIDTMAKIKDFYSKRILRIYPVYWTAILFNLAMFNSTIPTLSLTDYVWIFSGFHAFSGQLRFLTGFYAAFWFIGVIVSLYLLYPVILAMIKRTPHLSLLSLLLISVISLLVMAQLQLIRGDWWFPLCRVFEFGLGIYLIRIGLYPRSINANNILAFLSIISFYVYLVHLPLIVLLGYNVILFLLITLVIASMLYTFDNAMKRTISKQVRKVLRFMKQKRSVERSNLS